jgi:hypothetical protein
LHIPQRWSGDHPRPTLHTTSDYGEGTVPIFGRPGKKSTKNARKKQPALVATSTSAAVAAPAPATPIAGLATTRRALRLDAEHDTEEETEHEDEQPLDAENATITDLTEIMEIIKTNAVWKDFAEEFGEDVVRAVIEAQAWERRGNDIVDADGQIVDLKLVRRLLEEHMSGSRAHAGAKGDTATAGHTDPSSTPVAADTTSKS